MIIIVVFFLITIYNVIIVISAVFSGKMDTYTSCRSAVRQIEVSNINDKLLADTNKKLFTWVKNCTLGDKFSALLRVIMKHKGLFVHKEKFTEISFIKNLARHFLL